MDSMLEGRVLGRMLLPEDVASVVALLIWPGASAMTGTDILVDGGAVGAFVRKN
jgi:NAD(P)-dependent dehydrogenase (short-subunit alcohol dehydrogenase family)